MISTTEKVHSDLESNVAAKYKAQGFEVIIEPQKTDIPFDLGNYHPDLVAKKSPTEGYIIEVKNNTSRTPIDRYREVAETVSLYPGWSFLLVTGEDVPQRGMDNEPGTILTWQQMRNRQTKVESLISLGAVEGAFLSLWAILEAALRRRAKESLIPIERLPSLSLINHLYSQGELSIEQFDQAIALQAIRNQFIHGYQTTSLDEYVKQLQQLVAEVLNLWDTSTL